MLEGILSSYPIVGIVLQILGTIVILASVIVPFLPESFQEQYEEFKDHSIGKKVLKFLKGFSVIKKKNGKLLPSHEDK